MTFPLTERQIRLGSPQGNCKNIFIGLLPFFRIRINYKAWPFTSNLSNRISIRIRLRCPSPGNLLHVQRKRYKFQVEKNGAIFSQNLPFFIQYLSIYFKQLTA
jgi:hypothetical protein